MISRVPLNLEITMINIRKSKDDQFYFTVTAKNGKILVSSETYKKKPFCIKGIMSLFKNLTEAVEKMDDKHTAIIVDHTLQAK